MSLLINEVISNGYIGDLCLTLDDEKNNDYSIMNIVDDKLKCLRHKQMGYPLNRSEMLSIILYTAGESNYNLCSSQRSGNYLKWKYFDLCLYSAINKLSKREYGSYKIYIGLKDTKLDCKYIASGYFKTYVSTSYIKAISLESKSDIYSWVV